MKGLFTLVIALVVSCGCSGQRPSASDPFILGRTKVPPPATGAASGNPSDPYYRSPPTGTMPQTSLPQTSPPQTSLPQTSPPQTSLPQTSPPRTSLVSDATSSHPRELSDQWTTTPVTVSPKATPKTPAPATVSLASRDPVIQVLRPRPNAADSSTQVRAQGSTITSTPAEPRRLQPPSGAVDIMDLPKAGTSNDSRRAESSSETDGFRLVSGTEDAGDSASDPSADSASPSTYGHASDYQWLRGKIEHSQIDNCWKLRYIPVDGATDEFGGSVVLPDPAVLSGYERGELVEIRGRIANPNPKKGYAPTYEVAEIKRLGSTRR
ncbi:MAG: hypothetical protein A2V70_15265 [Planctomycetes bacterium RBG_13_63_9]|nr:MAG: hypothetical protein A2V70_15265 [Planctomycetes bacterium RBG_13_63_9]